MTIDLLRVESSERVDLSDFEFISESVQGQERQLIDNLVCDPARSRKWVISGFVPDNPTGSQVRVTGGKAILAMRVGGVIQYGVLATAPGTEKIVDTSGYSPPGTYGIYIRFERIAGDAQSRIFWNPAGDGSEYAQTINTRWTADWSMRVERDSPGADWLMVGEATLPGMGITDRRPFFFEGEAFYGYKSGWSTDGGGAATDRNSARQTYPITDIQMMFAATRQCLEDIKGRNLRKWWERDIGGMNIGFDAAAVEDRLAVYDANFALEIDTANPQITLDSLDFFQYLRSSNTLLFQITTATQFQWDADGFWPQTGTLDLGKSGKEWAEIWGEICTLSDELRIVATTNPSILLKDIAAGTDKERWRIELDAGPPNVFSIIAYNDAETLSEAAVTITRAAQNIRDITLTSSVGAGTIDLITDDGRLGLGGANSGVAYIECHSHLTPDSDNARDLGAAGTEWRHLYLDGIAWIDTLSLSALAGQGCDGDFVPATTSSYSLGNDSYDWSSAYFRGARPYVQFYGTAGALDEKTWRVGADSSGLELWGTRDSGASATQYLTVSRTAETTPVFTFLGQVIADRDSGHPTKPYADAFRVRGVNPVQWIEEEDTGVDAECRHWSMSLEQGVGGATDRGNLLFSTWDADRTTTYNWLTAETTGGTILQWQVANIILTATTEIILNATVGLGTDTGAPAASDVGFCDIYYSGAGGAAFSIKGVTGSTNRTSEGFIKIYVNGAIKYLPYFGFYNG